MQHHIWRRLGLPSRTGSLNAALVACLFAGQLAAFSPARSGTGATAVDRTSASGIGAAAAPTDRRQQARVAAAARARAAAAGAAHASRAQRSQAAGTPARVIKSRTAAVRPAATVRPATTVRPPTTVRPASPARILAEARRHTGKPYRWGASGPNAFDCSGFTRYVFARAAGLTLPHKANTQQYFGRPVSRSAARPGDLVVFRTGTYAYHVGIYAGGGYMYDAPRPGKPVGKHKIWSNGYVVRRLAP